MFFEEFEKIFFVLIPEHCGNFIHLPMRIGEEFRREQHSLFRDIIEKLHARFPFEITGKIIVIQIDEIGDIRKVDLFGHVPVDVREGLCHLPVPVRPPLRIPFENPEIPADDFFRA